MARVSKKALLDDEKYYLSFRNGFLLYITAGRGVARYHIEVNEITGIETLRLTIDDTARRVIGAPQSIEDVQAWLEPKAHEVARRSYLEDKERKERNNQYNKAYRSRVKKYKKFKADEVYTYYRSSDDKDPEICVFATHYIEATSEKHALRQVRQLSEAIKPSDRLKKTLESMSEAVYLVVGTNFTVIISEVKK